MQKEERIDETPEDDEPDAGATAMAELFHSIGFDVGDENSYNRLVEYVESKGVRTNIDRGEAVLHGRCLKLGGGLEVWSVLYERGSDFYYADCRPAFRSRYYYQIGPWELIEFDEDGEAIVRGTIDGLEIVFELQNLTEISNRMFREPQLKVALAGIAYWADARPRLGGSAPHGRFELAERLEDYAENACESDYVIDGRVLALRELLNPVTGARMCWMFVDTGVIRLELIANDAVVNGRVRIGSRVTAGIWLQGHVLAESEISERYEGVDPDHEPGDSWVSLRRGN
jgi:hypothetical protein